MLYLLSYVLLPLLAACLLLAMGYNMFRRREIVPNNRGQFHLQQTLDSWRIDENAPLQTLQDVNKHLKTLTAFLFMGMGISMLLAAIVMACVALFTTGTLLAGNSMRGEPLMEVMLLLLFAGSWLGESFGFRKLRREAKTHLTFGDLRRRLAADYRSPLLHVIPVVLGIVNTIVALMSISSIPSPVRILLMNDTIVWWPTWIFLIIPMLILLLPLIVEASIRSVVRFPRLLVTTSPELAQQIDNMLRAIMIGSLLGSEYTIVGNLQMGQFLLFGKTAFLAGLSNKLPDYIQAWLLISYLISMILIVVGVGAGMLKGHVGGKISGWPWQSTKEALNGTAVTDS